MARTRRSYLESEEAVELEREWEERAYLLTGKGNRGEPIEREVGGDVDRV